MDKGNLFVVAAPSGAGKTTLVKALVDSLPKVTVSISHTTRPKRSTEMHGLNYYFVDTDEFKRRIQEQDFLEYALVFDHYYGTSKQWVHDTLAKGIDVILEIDWQGFQQIKGLFPETIGIFVLPPSLIDLHDRLIKRNQDHPEVIKKRLADAKETVRHIHEFDYVVINDDFVKALNDLRLIVEANRLLRRQQSERLTHLTKDFEQLSVD